MKKYSVFLFVFSIFLISGCSVDYTSYYKEYGDVSNKEYPDSYYIEDGVFVYPSDNSELIEKYGEVYNDVASNYKVYATYYSSFYDTLYISYDNIATPVQTIDVKGLMMIEEHLLNYFEGMDSKKSDYKEYLKAVRIYPDYHSSTCRKAGEPETSYSKIEGCADYNPVDAKINLNGLTSIDRFFNPYTYVVENQMHYIEPKRDTFAHEFGHISTYYYLTLKSDDSYEDYLRVRLKEKYDELYPTGMPEVYNTSDLYYIQPVEILADDYVELFYDTSEKLESDYYEYTLEYEDLRNSLSKTTGVTKKLKDNPELLNEVKEFYNVVINDDYDTYDEKIVVSVNGITYNTLHDIVNQEAYISLSNKDVVVLGEVTINDKEYYRIIVSNIIEKTNSRKEYSENIAYVLKEECVLKDNHVIKFNKYNGEVLPFNGGVTLETLYPILAYYDFSYFICEDDKVIIYSYLNGENIRLERAVSLFS